LQAAHLESFEMALQEWHTREMCSMVIEWTSAFIEVRIPDILMEFSTNEAVDKCLMADERQALVELGLLRGYHTMDPKIRTQGAVCVISRSQLMFLRHEIP
jgi:hypothetical protein